MLCLMGRNIPESKKIPAFLQMNNSRSVLDRTTECNRKWCKEAPWLIARRMALTLHLLLFRQSM